MDQTVRNHAAPDDRRRRFRRTLVAVGAGFAIALGGLGIASAQTGPGETTTTTTAPGDGEPRHGPGRHALRGGLAAAARAIGISKEELRTAVRNGRSIAEVAQSKGVDVQKVIDAIVAEAKDRLAAKVQSGALSQARADQKLANLSQRVTNFVNRTGAPRHGRGPGPRSEGNRGPS